MILSFGCFLRGTSSSRSSMFTVSGRLFHGWSSPEPRTKKAKAPKMYVPANIANTICHCPYAYGWKEQKKKTVRNVKFKLLLG